MLYLVNEHFNDPKLKVHNSLPTEGFDDFLKTLDSERDKAAVKYLRLRERIERFFEWRNCENVEELADIVFDRTARKIVEGENVLHAEAYCVSVAKFVLLENRREGFRTEKLDEDSSNVIGGFNEKRPEDNNDLNEKRLRCLESCLSEFPDNDRKLIVDYFDTDERTLIRTRKRLAKSYGATLNSLRIRVCRLKSKLEKCTKKCCES